MLASIIAALTLSLGLFDLPVESCNPVVLDEGTVYQPLEIRSFKDVDSACEVRNVVASIVGVVMTSSNLETLVRERPQILEEVAQAEAILLLSLTQTGAPLPQALSSRIPLPGVNTWNMQDLDRRLYQLLGVMKQVNPQYFCGAVYYLLPEDTSQVLSSERFVLTADKVRGELILTLSNRQVVPEGEVELLCGPPPI